MMERVIKPRIWLAACSRDGLWVCQSREQPKYYGFGYSPKDAYNDWLRWVR